MRFVLFSLLLAMPVAYGAPDIVEAESLSSDRISQVETWKSFVYFEQPELHCDADVLDAYIAFLDTEYELLPVGSEEMHDHALRRIYLFGFLSGCEDALYPE